METPLVNPIVLKWAREKNGFTIHAVPGASSSMSSGATRPQRWSASTVDASMAHRTDVFFALPTHERIHAAVCPESSVSLSVPSSARMFSIARLQSDSDGLSHAARATTAKTERIRSFMTIPRGATLPAPPRVRDPARCRSRATDRES